MFFKKKEMKKATWNHRFQKQGKQNLFIDVGIMKSKESKTVLSLDRKVKENS